MATIIGSATAVPRHRATQSQVKDQIGRIFRVEPRRLAAIQNLFENCQVESRHCALPVEQLLERRSLSVTSAEYRRQAVELGRDVARRCLADAELDASCIDLVVTVSCTGFMIPSLDAYLVEALGFRRDVRRLPITELGCMGGAAALARAADFLRGFPESNVLVVAVELPSLTLQHDDLSQANLVSTALFGDGAAAVAVTGRAVGGGRLRVLDVASHLFESSLAEMGFDLVDDGFHIVLSRHVPALLARGLGAALQPLLRRAGITREDLSFFIVHPGGKKVLCAVEEALGISSQATQASWDVLRRYGNQSSAAVLFVLHEWRSRGELRPPPGALGLLAGFGPGVSAEMLLLRWT